jgi:quinol monooxygenase YgiN
MVRTEKIRMFMELTIEIRVKTDKFQELYQTLQALLPTIRKEKGCSDCRIYRDVEDGEIFYLSVHWKAVASLVHYMKSSSGNALLGAIDLLSETAKVSFGQDAPWEGIDSLKRMRKKT